jgi:hypothetical protein
MARGPPSTDDSFPMVGVRTSELGAPRAPLILSVLKFGVQEGLSKVCTFIGMLYNTR